MLELYKQEVEPLMGLEDKDLLSYLTVERELRGISIPRGFAVLDLETTGLEPCQCELISYGIVKEDRAKVVTRLSGDVKGLVNILKDELDDVYFIIAFYHSFEASWLNSLGIDPWQFDWYELKVQRGRLVDIMPFGFGDPYNGAQIPELWREWQTKRDWKSLVSIIHHNMADIIREAFLWALIENGAFGFDRGGNR